MADPHPAPAPRVEVVAGPSRPTRRSLLARACGWAMTASLIASYGTFAWIAGRFLMPSRPRRRGWLVVGDVAGFARGDTRLFVAPAGERIVVARRLPAGGSIEDASVGEFVALSSTCPHLGCQVRWEAPLQRFFCPCHNGTFDAGGTATGGPPLDARQSLPRYPLLIRGGLLYIEVPLEGALG